MRCLSVALLCAFSFACKGDRDSARAVPASEAKDAAPRCAGKICNGRCVDLGSDPAHCGSCEKSCDVGAGCIESLCTTAIGWSVSARAAVAGDAGSCEVGKRSAVRCPAGGLRFSVWGTDLYTDDSAVCVAAVHAGKITLEKGGDVALEIRAGAPHYDSTTKNGVTSNTWAAWGCSFVFLSRECGSSTRRCDETCVDVSIDARHCGACGHACGVDESCRKGTCLLGTDATWTTTLGAKTCTPSTTYTFHCPPGPPATWPSVWGTSVYTHDSAVCVAAVHAGKIVATVGGTVVAELRAGEPSYKGSTANGVTSRAYAAWTCSYVLR